MNRKKLKTFCHNIAVDDDVSVTRTYQLQESVTTRDWSGSSIVAFDDIPIDSYFLFDFALDPVGTGNPTGLYWKSGRHFAILLMDELAIYNSVFFEDATLGTIGTVYTFDTDCVKAISNEDVVDYDVKD